MAKPISLWIKQPIPAAPGFPRALPSKFNLKEPIGGGDHLRRVESLAGEENYFPPVTQNSRNLDRLENLYRPTQEATRYLALSTSIR